MAPEMHQKQCLDCGASLKGGNLVGRHLDGQTLGSARTINY